MELLSIVTPVFNVESTLQQCIKSIVSQSYHLIELILVDDGSTDSSPKICDHWRDKDDRIKVIHKANGGLSDARNVGIKTASGKYITFIDSDDFLGEETISSLMEILRLHPEYDILEYPIYEYYGSDKENILSFDSQEYTDMTAYWLQEKVYQHSYACNKIYRKSLFDTIKYPVGRVFEDIATLPKLLKAANVVATTNQGLYYYCYNVKGITISAGSKEWEMLLTAHTDFISTSGLRFDTVIAQQYYMHVVNIQLYTYALSGQPPVLSFIQINNWGQIKPFSLKVKAIALNILGIKRLCRIYKTIQKFKRSR